MSAIQKTQQGASTVVAIILLVLIGVSVYIGLQYIPQIIETGTVDTILENLETRHRESPFTSVTAVQNAINRQLNINQMDDLRDNFKVTEQDDAYVVKVTYERELNLIYEKKTIQTGKSLILTR
jgi:hypothetical protein